MEESVVVVVGAGIAGIAAARALHDRGFKVIVLESSQRIAGRIHTDSHSFGFPVDMGASWIHGASPAQNPIAAIAKQLGLATHQTSGDGSPLYDHDFVRGFEFYRGDGEKIPRKTVHEFEQWFRKIVGKVRAELRRGGGAAEAELRSGGGGKDLSLAETMKKVVEKNGLVEGSIYSELLSWFVCRIEGWFAVDAERISALSWAEEEFYDGGHELLVDGYAPLVKALAVGLDVRTGHPVVSIEHSSNYVRIVTEDGSCFVADAAVVSVPLGVLKQGLIAFEPELPGWKLEAIAGLEVGQQNKIALLFESVFWPKDAELVGGAAGTPSECSYFLSLYPSCGRPVLVYMPVGELAREIEALSDEAATEFAMDRLRKMIPGAPEKPLASIISRWGLDPNFLGCYSFDPAEHEHNLHEKMSIPVGVLFFAGEAASPECSSTVHGAYETGVEAAKQIIAAKPWIKKKPGVISDNHHTLRNPVCANNSVLRSLNPILMDA